MSPQREPIDIPPFIFITTLKPFRMLWDRTLILWFTVEEDTVIRSHTSGLLYGSSFMFSSHHHHHHNNNNNNNNNNNIRFIHQYLENNLSNQSVTHRHNTKLRTWLFC